MKKIILIVLPLITMGCEHLPYDDGIRTVYIEENETVMCTQSITNITGQVIGYIDVPCK